LTWDDGAVVLDAKNKVGKLGGAVENPGTLKGATRVTLGGVASVMVLELGWIIIDTQTKTHNETPGTF
jgi:hypothetical protein